MQHLQKSLNRDRKGESVPRGRAATERICTNMAGSQLKRLKASLREQGLIGPQKSKKQKRRNAHDQTKDDKRLERAEALARIREQFNPFQFKTNARGPKFDVTTNKPASDKTGLVIKGRPGLSKAIGEERVRLRATRYCRVLLTVCYLAASNPARRDAAAQQGRRPH